MGPPKAISRKYRNIKLNSNLSLKPSTTFNIKAQLLMLCQSYSILEFRITGSWTFLSPELPSISDAWIECQNVILWVSPHYFHVQDGMTQGRAGHWYVTSGESGELNY